MLTDITYGDIEYIFFNLRKGDREEIFALRSHDNDFRMAYEAYTAIINSGRGKISWVKGRPAVLGAFTELHTGMWEVWLCGTDNFVAGLKPMMRWIRDEANDLLTTQNVNRLQCDSRADYAEAHKLITALGGRQESVLRKYGKDGSDYIRWTWFPDDNDTFLKPHYVQSKEAKEAAVV